MGAIVYFGIKFVAYALWCWFGLRLFQPSRESRMAMAIGLGALRSCMGLGFGWESGWLARKTNFVVEKVGRLHRWLHGVSGKMQNVEALAQRKAPPV